MIEQLKLKRPFIDPRWLRSFRTQRVVKNNNEIIINDVALEFPCDSKIFDGSEVEVFISNGFFAQKIVLRLMLE